MCAAVGASWPRVGTSTTCGAEGGAAAPQPGFEVPSTCAAVGDVAASRLEAESPSTCQPESDVDGPRSHGGGVSGLEGTRCRGGHECLQ